MELNKVYLGDSLEVIKSFPDNSIDCVVTSPPYYGLRDYGTGKWTGGDPNCDHEAAREKQRFDYPLQEGGIVYQGTNAGSSFSKYKKVCPVCGAVREDSQIGLEESPEEYIEKLVSLFREIRKKLKDVGTVWVNLGDSYAAQRGGSYQPEETLSGGIHGKTPEGGNTNRGRGEQYNAARNASAIGLKHKDLIGIPWMFAFAMRADGWYLRQDIIWAKGNPMPESVTDRCTKSHEYIFLFSKKEKYYFDHEAIMEPCADQERTNYQSGGRTYGLNADRNDNDLGERSKTWKPKVRTSEQGYAQAGGHRDNSGGFKGDTMIRNKRSVWTVNVKPTKEAHFATYPPLLISPCILAGCPENGVVLDPFMGSGTTGIVARQLNRNFVGIELNPEYHKMAERRIFNEGENLFNQMG